VARSQPTLSIGKSRLSANVLVYPSPFTPTCCVMPVAMRWPMQGMIRDAFKAGWVIARYNTPCAIPSYRRHRSRTSGAAKRLRTSVYVADSFFKSIQVKISPSNLKRAKLTQGKGRGVRVPFPIGASSTESATDVTVFHSPPRSSGNGEMETARRLCCEAAPVWLG